MGHIRVSSTLLSPLGDMKDECVLLLPHKNPYSTEQKGKIVDDLNMG